MRFVPVRLQSARLDRVPILDRRQRLSGRQRLTSRLATGVLWLGLGSQVGLLKLLGLLAAGGLVLPWVLWLDRPRHQRPVAAAAIAPPPAWQELSRALLAAGMGVGESQLFRARHARICIVHHDAGGRIVALEVAFPAELVPSLRSDAHPVG